MQCSILLLESEQFLFAYYVYLGIALGDQDSLMEIFPDGLHPIEQKILQCL